MTFKPNKLQAEALKCLAETKSNKGVIVMPTGTGKTFMAVLWAKNILNKEPKAKFLFVCHNSDILAQANEKEFQTGLKKFNIEFGYYNGEHKDKKQITFGTLQTLERNLNKFSPKYFDYIICDECHHAQAKTFKKVLLYFKPKFLLGLTATPHRLDGISIYKIFGEAIYQAETYDGIKSNILSKFKYYDVENDIDFSKIPLTNGRYKAKDLNKHLCISEYDKAIYDEYIRYKKKFKFKKTIVFCATCEHAHRMNDVFNSKNIKSIDFIGREFVNHHWVAQRDRKQKLKDFRDGKYSVIFCRDLFNEGIDIPNADCILFLRPTQSSTIFTQQLGRGLRKAKGKKHLICLDFVGNSNKCELNTSVIGEAIGVDIIKKIEDMKLSKRNKNKEFIICNLGCKVILTPKKLNVLRDILQRSPTSKKEAIVKKYLEVKKKYNRTPKLLEVLVNLRQLKSILGLNHWNDFVRSMGDIPATKRTKKEILEVCKKEYYEIKNRINAPPRTADLSKKVMASINGSFGSLNKFRKLIGEQEIIGKYQSTNKDQIFTEIKDVYFDVKRKEGNVHSHSPEILKYKRAITKFWGTFTKFKKLLGEPISKLTGKKFFKLKSKRKNVKFFDTKFKDEPNELIFPKTTKKDKNIVREKLFREKPFANSKEKSEFRPLILKNVSNGETILLLESPQLKAIKEIEKLGIKPKKIVIPNNVEFRELCKALNNYDTKLNIEVYRASAFQFIKATRQKFDFMWLDYNGGFIYYQRDLELVLQKYKDLKLFLTYNIFDLIGGNDYFGKVFDFVLARTEKPRLYPELTKKYKKMFFNVALKLGRYAQ